MKYTYINNYQVSFKTKVVRTGLDMDFIHVTNEVSAKAILKSKSLIAKKQDLTSLLDRILERLFNRIESGDFIELFEDESVINLSGYRYPYLGEGVYCFEKADIEYAKKYDANKKEFIEFSTIDSVSFLDLNEKDQYKILTNRVENHFNLWIASEMDENDKLSVEVLKEVILLNLQYLTLRESNGVPFALGIMIDRLNYGSKNDIIAFKYPKREANYVAIKQTCVITKIQGIAL
jgi:hypothetical protein